MIKSKRILAFLIFVAFVLIFLFFLLFYGCGYVGNDGPVITTTTTIPDTGKKWGTPTLIASGLGEDPYPRAAMGGSGDSILLWQGSGDLWAARFDGVSATWETAGKITSMTGGISEYRLGMDAGGNALAVWSQKRTGEQYYDIYANRYIAGADWGSDTRIEAVAGDSKEVKLAVSASGDAVAVWINNALSGKLDICSSIYAKGAGWGSVEVIAEIGDETTIFFPAVNHRGDAIVVWEQSDQFDIMHIHAKRYIKGTGWGGDEEVENFVGSSSYPQALIDGGGNAIVIWLGVQFGNDGIYANRYDAATGSWGEQEKIVSEYSIFQTVIDNDSNATLVRLDHSAVNTKRYRSATNDWGPDIEINDPMVGDFSWRFSMAAGGNGDVMVLWVQPYFDSYHIWANHYGAAADKWGRPGVIEQLKGFSDWPEIAMDENGNATAAWLQFDLGDINLWSNRYE